MTLANAPVFVEAAPEGWLRHVLSAAWGDLPPDENLALQRSIDLLGVLNPIAAFEDGDDVQIFDGWHRYQGAHRMGRSCPAWLFPRLPRIATDQASAYNATRRHIGRKQDIAKAVGIMQIGRAHV